MAEGETTVIGWQGITAWVPADWMLAGVGGDRRQGYLRVDYERMPRLQVKWARRHIDLERKREEYIKRLTVGSPSTLTLKIIQWLVRRERRKLQLRVGMIQIKPTLLLWVFCLLLINFL